MKPEAQSQPQGYTIKKASPARVTHPDNLDGACEKTNRASWQIPTKSQAASILLMN
ncbi:hypothetical protein EMIT0196P_30297 [Pseudomonas chlororaphis]